MSLAYLRKQKTEYTTAKNNLLAALNSSSTLFSNIMSVSEALNEIDIGGKGLDNGEFPGQKTNVNNIRSSINSMIDYCNNELSKIDSDIEIELAKINNNNNNTSGSSNNNSSSTGSKPPSAGSKPPSAGSKPPSAGGRFSATAKVV